MKRRSCLTIVMALVSLMMITLTGCGKDFELKSSAFIDANPIPEKYWYTQEGNISPPFNWVNPPAGTESFALVMRHPHGAVDRICWAVFNIPADCNEIPENASGKNMPKGSIELINSWRTSGYYGMTPLRGGGTFDWITTVYALNTAVIDDLAGFKSPLEIDAILAGKVIAEATILGTASRQ